MKFQVGDKVVIQHSNEKGEVVEIINDKMVMVDVRGVKFPAYADQLDFPYFKQFTEKKLFPPGKPPKKYIDQVPSDRQAPDRKAQDAASANRRSQRFPGLAPGVWMTFLPVFDNDEFGDDVVDELKIHLVNNTGLDYHFAYTLKYGGNPDFELDNQVNAFQDFYLHDIPFDKLNDNPVFGLEFSLLKPDKNKAEYYESSLKLRAKQVFTRIEEIKQKGEATFSFKLFDEYPGRPYEEPVGKGLTGTGPASINNPAFRMYEASRARQHLEPARQELDLHIEKLTEKGDSLDNFEMLTLQLQTFEKYLDIALAHHLPSMVVIHGVGSGKLRDEIHETLRMRKGVKSFVNRYHPKYGYGATEIAFQY
ncbi:MAG: Smr/MutS family protein [Bacteroidota bacterium]|nr:Smr/MutS family protein [Bacteroidota bacterium]MDP4254147.1 Smr/MutS family protein [Bacteroidota bacterium]MDP4259641.1 Smr/MutS family protein [Bacteroidota bacterium]